MLYTIKGSSWFSALYGQQSAPLAVIGSRSGISRNGRHCLFASPPNQSSQAFSPNGTEAAVFRTDSP